MTSSRCFTCDALFTPTRSWSRYCSQLCRVNSPDKRQRSKKYQSERREKLNEYKLQKGCVECGYKGHPAALDFNHRNPLEKSFNISQDTKRCWDDMMKEIEKCDVLCANCHRIHTYNEKHWGIRR